MPLKIVEFVRTTWCHEAKTKNIATEETILSIKDLIIIKGAPFNTAKQSH